MRVRGVEIRSGLTVNSVIWISSLRAGEEGLTRRVTEDLSTFFGSIALPFQMYNAESVPLLEDALGKIEQATHSGMRPILHFDMHGSKENGLEIAETKKFASWPLVVKKLQAINIASHNNLCVVSGSCFGLHAIRQVTINEACPFYVLIAPENEVSFGFLEDHTVPFYTDVFSAGDLIKSYDRKDACRRADQVHSPVVQRKIGKGTP
jgi:hypothetical protein